MMNIGRSVRADGKTANHKAVKYIASVLRISAIELRKSRRKYSRSSFLLLLTIGVLALFLMFFALSTGVKSDAYLYEVSMEINDYRFVYSDNPDIVVRRTGVGYDVFVTGSDKSLSAVDEFRKIVKENYEAELYGRYGIKAFPVFVKAVFLERKVVTEFSPNVSALRNLDLGVGETNLNAIEEKRREEKAVEIVSESFQNKISIKPESDYTIPEDFNPQSLLRKMFIAFFFIIPSYFVIQLFSASMLEDKVTRRLDVLLSTPVTPLEILLGKMLPYMIISALMILFVSYVLNESFLAILFVYPFILFAFSIQAFIVLISRSYKEMTFLIMVVSFLMTAYLFIPAIFSGTIPVSKISPITNMLAFFETGELSVEYCVLSTSQFYLLFLVLMFNSVKMMSPEIMHSPRGIETKVFSTLVRWIKSLKACFFASLLSIPFVFISEFMIISVIFTMPFQYSIPVFVFLIALIEELFKTSIVYAYFRNFRDSDGIVRASVVTAFGFFAGEKTLSLIELGRNYTTLLLTGYLLLPLSLHILALLVFTFMIKRHSYTVAYLTAVVVHFAYDYSILFAIGISGGV
jgi:ABC-type Na+ efflux pump permease subunit